MKKPLLCAAIGAAVLLGIGRPAAAQTVGHWCATDEHNAQLERTFRDPQLAAERTNAEGLAVRLQQDDVFAKQFRAQHRTQAASRIVPVVVHVITNCGAESLTKAGILAGMAQLNADWSRQNTDTLYTRAAFKPYAANLDVEFRLAKIDPNGNPTDGIHRVSDIATDAINPRDLIKSVVPYWSGYFNVWIVDAIANPNSTPGTILGYAQFPGTGPWSTWGVVMRFDDWVNPLGNGRTAAHEIGHCFNLFHSFTDGGGCAGDCTSTGDRVCDTPASASSYEPCYRNSPRNTCSNETTTGTVYTTNVPDQDENFMSYNNCQNMFSLGQKARVDAAITSFTYIRDLISPANLTRTGVADGQVVADAGAVAYLATCQLSQQGKELVACQGRAVTFTDASYGTTISGVSWTFANATPATSTSANPSVVFNAPGRQIVTLTATGANGTSSTLNIPVRVMPLGRSIPTQESFEGGRQFADSLWRTASSSLTNSQRWKPVGIAAAAQIDGDTAVMVSLGSVPIGTANSLYSPPFDTRTVANNTPTPALAFDLAYARRSATSNDKLEVLFSSNCGQTWQVRRSISAATLATVTALQPAFAPSDVTQWRTETVNLTGPFFNQSSMMVQFRATNESTGASNQGNNVYIDNIRLTGRPLGIAETLAAAGIALAPNPVTTETSLTLTLDRATRVGVRVCDVLGRPVFADAARLYVPGNHTVNLGERLHTVSPGVYAVTIELNGQAYTQKLLVR